MARCSPIWATCAAGHQRIALSSASSMQSWPGYSSSLDFVPDFFLNSSFLTLNFLFLTSDFLTGSAESESKSPDQHRVRAAPGLEAREQGDHEKQAFLSCRARLVTPKACA